jgi:hypothetical protein
MKDYTRLRPKRTRREVHLDLKCSIEKEISGHTAVDMVGSAPRYLRAW